MIASRTGAATWLTMLVACSSPAGHARVRSGAPDAGVRVRQVLLVTPGAARTDAVAWALEQDGAGWRVVRGPMRAVIGRNGFAPAGEKREGDGRTPAGSFPIELAFGYAVDGGTRLPYRAATEKDLWVDDVDSDQYNTWVEAPTAARSFERMRRDDDLYELGLVVGYNTRPVVKGLGSAIFVHVWRGPDQPTAGCVALAKDDVAALLGWLDPSADPAIVMGPDAGRGFLPTGAPRASSDG